MNFLLDVLDNPGLYSEMFTDVFLPTSALYLYKPSSTHHELRTVSVNHMTVNAIENG
jgi:hypothetical protein